MTVNVAASQALRANGLLADLNRAGVLSAADVHVARRLGALGGETDEAVLLAVALVVRSTRHGSVVLDVETAEATTTVDEAVDEVPLDPAAPLAWPGEDWAARVRASPLTGGPLRMVGPRIWLARYWDQEEQVARELLARSATAPDDIDLDVLAAGLDRLFPRGADDDQREAAAVAALTRVSVIAGGPGTGKTTTVARLLALLREQQPTARIALAAPTGKAAARLEQAVRSTADGLPAEDRARVGVLSATTMHRLLGWRPQARSRFRHDRTNRLPAEIVVIDESSMVSLTLMARLLEALRPATRLVLVGDPDQLASIEAGAVLGDLVDLGSLGRRTPELAARLRTVLPGVAVQEQAASPEALVRDGVAELTLNRRFLPDSGIGRLARAIQAGRGDEALKVLRAGHPEVEFLEVADEGPLPAAALTGVQDDLRAWGAALHAAAERGDQESALVALDRHRLLCAHRLGPRGVAHWGTLATRWVTRDEPIAPRTDGHFAGQPLLVTTNDYEIGLYNGDTGVVVSDGAGGLLAVFGRGGAAIPIPLVRLGAVRPLYAMTVHRSQGSQFDRVTLVLPPATSPLATRETFYTTVTRTTSYLRVLGSEEAVTTAVQRPAARATGLRDRLSASH